MQYKKVTRSKWGTRALKCKRARTLRYRIARIRMFKKGRNLAYKAARTLRYHQEQHEKGRTNLKLIEGSALLSCKPYKRARDVSVRKSWARTRKGFVFCQGSCGRFVFARCLHCSTPLESCDEKREARALQYKKVTRSKRGTRALKCKGHEPCDTKKNSTKRIARIRMFKKGRTNLEMQADEKGRTNLKLIEGSALLSCKVAVHELECWHMSRR